MTSVKKNRSLLAWMLLILILANAYACALEHATHIGFRLALGGPALCLSDPDAPGADAALSLGHAHESADMPFYCPLCSSLLLLGALLLCLGWLGRPARQRLRAADGPLRTPRAHWPSLNPRAP
jgi:hypothetical protein